jgi:hypothetical protein
LLLACKKCTNISTLLDLLLLLLLLLLFQAVGGHRAVQTCSPASRPHWFPHSSSPSLLLPHAMCVVASSSAAVGAVRLLGGIEVYICSLPAINTLLASSLPLRLLLLLLLLLLLFQAA